MQLLSGKPTDFSFLEKLSDIAAKLEKWDEATLYLDLILEERPADMSVLQQKVKVHLKNNKLQPAIDILEIENAFRQNL